MKLNQKTVTIRLTEELSTDLFNFLDISQKSDEESLQELLRLGLAVKNGVYHDKSLRQIELQLKELQSVISTLTVSTNQETESLADLQDTISSNYFSH